MSHTVIKKVWDYCTYNKKFFIFILVLLFVSSSIQNYVRAYGNYFEGNLLQILVFIVISGYGMSITKSRINHGVRLPKIVIKDIIVMGIKSGIITLIYLFIQGVILARVGYALGFPAFNLEEFLLNWSDTIHMLFYHEPASTVLFVILGLILFYITTFFMEIALARLADTKKILSSLDLMAIKRNIDVIGWRNYTKRYTSIILVIVILSYLISFEIQFSFVDSTIDMFLSFLIFVTQYLGIGAVYCDIKDLESHQEKSSRDYKF